VILDFPKEDGIAPVRKLLFKYKYRSDVCPRFGIEPSSELLPSWRTRRAERLAKAVGTVPEM